MSNSIKTVTIGQLMVGGSDTSNLGKNFYVPQYQRGYRWKETQVKQFLDDLNSFEIDQKKKEKHFYCLQPLVVMRNRENTAWVVVDGQQRLTTIFIVLTCINKLLNRKNLIYNIHYESKPELFDTLQSLGNLENDVTIDTSDIDKFHVTSAYITAMDWFKSQGDESDDSIIGAHLMEKIKTYTRFIWYEVESNIEPEKLFTNINMGKIELTNAELIKALLLKKDNFIQKDDENNLVPENTEQISNSQNRVASEWNRIEEELHNEEFWKFLTGIGPFGSLETRIELIFRVMVKRILILHPDYFVENEKENNPKTYTFIIFDRELEYRKNTNLNSDNITPYSDLLESFWNEIVSYFYMFKEWFYEKEWFHLIGFLLYQENNQNEEFFEKLCCEYQDPNKSKNDFTRLLKKYVVEVLNIDENNDVSEESISTYLSARAYSGNQVERAKIKNSLLLFNLISMQNNNDADCRFSFNNFATNKWDIEHIHSVTTEKPIKIDERESWMDDASKFAEEPIVSAELIERMNDIRTNKKYTDEFTELYNKVYDELIEAFQSDQAKKDDKEESLNINGISNLTLLLPEINRGYKNKIFPYKRSFILQKAKEGKFIPLCTMNVFLKSYTTNVKQMFLWNYKNRKDYFDAMCTTIHEYLKDINTSEQKAETEGDH